jgi:nickel-type superoxide dismutase maturation protease
MFQVIRITGDSLSPQFHQGDFVVISKIPFLLNSLQAGDVIVFQQPIYGRLIKRVEQVTSGGQSYFVTGTDELSVDSRRFGLVDRQQVIGKVIWHIRGARA